MAVSSLSDVHPKLQNFHTRDLQINSDPASELSGQLFLCSPQIGLANLLALEPMESLQPFPFSCLG